MTPSNRLLWIAVRRAILSLIRATTRTTDDRAFWLSLRRELLAVNGVIEQQLQIGRHEPKEPSFLPRER